ncbi:MAG: Methionine-tRNA ligase [Candidatus Levybacteria bacterium GW2011_GWB1_35_5]|nr:MAG: Methionine-tRNA ligase [Candidatus Levybacteria bacterium GW2011_GWB1_35_5]
MNVTFDDFKKIEIRVGKVLICEKIENADKLLRLQVDFGDFKRQIISAVAQWYDPKDLEGKLLPFIVNLEPRNFRGEESQGMLMAAEGEDKPIFLESSEEVKEGSLVV